ncbi:multidrug/hemolysin transport system permease protein [Fontibacillus phaseoli]|uniref:Transport permease protein n=1 Tax=Fontibacillus phaseoli TaxID=1416533 RepID=A0A369BAL0_9BACL|nr:ABC transporter permease [Fontibacillus phaseoli]RCX18560.1 multidrug/hemolysin transport system permease protein [Fontibacillus phaseoli]
MIGFTKRNLKIFFRDRSSVFFSLLAVFIILGLYVLFLGDVWTSNLKDVPGAREMMDNWIIAGMLAVTTFTTSMGAFGIMINDKTQKITKDFYSSPLSRNSIAGGYVLSAFIIALIMSVVTLVLGEIYIIANGGTIMSLPVLLKVLVLIVLSAFVNTAIIFFIVSFFKSQNAFATASTIIGTLIGFLTGIYLPISMLPEGVQWIIKLFPVSHAAALFRQVMMEAPIASSFEGMPSENAAEFKDMMGVTFNFGDYTTTATTSTLVLIVTAVVFYGLSVYRASLKKV